MEWICFIAPPEVNFLCVSAKLSCVFTKGIDGGSESMCINFPLNQYLIISLPQWVYYPLKTEIFLTDAVICSTVMLPPSHKSRNPFHILFNIEDCQDMKHCIALLMLFHSRKNIQVHLGMEKSAVFPLQSTSLDKRMAFFQGRGKPTPNIFWSFRLQQILLFRANE